MIDQKQLGQAAKSYIDELILPSDPFFPLWNRENFIFKKKPKWNYIDGCMMTALLMLYERYGDERLLSYAENFISAYLDSSGNIPTLNFEDHNLDNINGGKNLLRLYRLTKKDIYMTAAEKLVKGQLAQQPRLKCGNFWHKKIYPNQIWIDGTYMVLPFMAEYGKITNNSDMIDDVCMQIENIRSIMRDSDTGLYYHGYDESRYNEWADPETGLSKEFWLRAMGWMCAALADLSEILPEKIIFRDMLSDLLNSLSVLTLPDGMLMQLPQYPELKDNYPETSGTLLFAYSALKAENLGLVDGTIGDYGKKALGTVAEKYISFDLDGKPILRNICLMAGLGIGRNGSIEYYLSEKKTENDAKGIAPFLMAYNELIR